MKKCPKCQFKVTLLQLMKHSCFTPIFCKECGAKFCFQTRYWYMSVAPLLIVIILSVIFFDSANYSQKIGLISLEILLMIFFISLYLLLALIFKSFDANDIMIFKIFLNALKKIKKT